MVFFNKFVNTESLTQSCVSGDIKGVFIMYFETSELSGGNAESYSMQKEA